MKKNVSWIKSPWTIAITSTLLLPVLSILTDLIKKLPILSSLKQVFIIVLKYSILFLNLQIKVWIIIVLIGLSILILYLIANHQNQNTLVKPEFCSYTSGKLKIWKWTWTWKFDPNKKAWVITDLTALCPECPYMST